MLGLVLILSLAGLIPAPLAPSWLLPEGARVSLDERELLLELDLHAPSPGALDDVGATLSRGLRLGDVDLGLDGVPGTPFLSNLLHAYEIPRIPQIDPQTLMGQVMVRVRVTLD